MFANLFTELVVVCILASEKEENQKRDQDFGEPQNWDECDCVGSNCQGSSGKSSFGNNSPLTVRVLQFNTRPCSGHPERQLSADACQQKLLTCFFGLL